MGETAVIVIWFVVMFPCLILVAALLTNEAKPKKNIILGVTLPLLAQSDPRVGDIVRRFKRNVWLCTAPWPSSSRRWPFSARASS